MTLLIKMDASFNDFYEEEDIRQPDGVKKEQLLLDTRSEFEKQLDEVLYLSLLESKELQETNEKYEEEIINNYYIEVNKRKNSFAQLLFNLNKLVRLNADIKEIYEIIEPIIDSYCNQIIEFVELDSLIYDKIFKIIGTIRTNKSDIELLKTILVRV